MPGAEVVSNASSTLLFPFVPGSLLCPRLPPRVAFEVGVGFGSVLQVSRCFQATVDLSAVDRFSARLQAWRRDIPLFSSLLSATFDSAFGASLDAIIAAQLSGVRAALSTGRAALSSEVCP